MVVGKFSGDLVIIFSLLGCFRCDDGWMEEICIDWWLWVVWQFKIRLEVTKVCAVGYVMVNGCLVKPVMMVWVGDWVVVWVYGIDC